ncbi:MAG: ATP-binding protein [Usitatibacter sp.]
MSPRRIIFRRYALIISATLAGTLGAYALLEIAFSTRQNVRRAQEFHVSEARALAGRVSFFFEEIQRNFVAVASFPWSRGLPVTDRMGEYQRIMRLLPAVREVVLADDKGAELFFVSRTDPDRIASGRVVDTVLFEGAGAANARFSAVRHERAGSAPFVLLAFRDRGQPGVFALATVNLQFVSDELARMPRRGKESAYLLDAEGRLVAHSDVSRPLKAKAQDRSLLDRIGNEAEGSQWLRNEGGALTLSVWRKLENPPWTVIVESPWQEALDPVLAALYRALAFIAIAIACAVLISRWLADRMARPVVTLKEGAEAFGAGDLDHRIELHTGDELEELAKEFNLMAAQLQDYTVGLERKVDEKTARLQEAMRARALFLAAASHDLRQPLYAISILADTMALEMPPGTTQTMLGKQRQAIGVLRELFDNLLDLSRFESGEIRPRLRDVRLREVFAPAAVEHEVLCEAKGLKWINQVEDAWVRTDPELVRRLASNLLSNAVRYTPTGKVSLIARVTGAEVSVTIADTGVGISPSDQKRVFEEFVQLENPSRDRDRGVGLGLAIVARIDRLLGARLALESEAGRGTRVTFHIPVAVEVAMPTVDEAIEPTAPDLSGLRVWVVEDNAMVRDALAAQLGAWGVDAAFAATRAQVEALRESDGGWADAVVLDDMLEGGENGLEVARWLAEHIPAHRIVMATGNVDPQRVQLLEESGLRVLRKPMAASVLARLLHDAACLDGSSTTSRERARAG